MAQLQAYASGGTAGSSPVRAAGGDPSGRGAVGRGVREGGSTKTLSLRRRQHGALESAGAPQCDRQAAGSGGGPNGCPLDGAKSGTLASAFLKILLPLSRCLKLGLLAAGWWAAHGPGARQTWGQNFPPPEASSPACASGSVGWPAVLCPHPRATACQGLRHCCHLLGPAGKAGSRGEGGWARGPAGQESQPVPKVSAG